MHRKVIHNHLFYVPGADYAGMAANERIYSTKTQITQKSLAIEDAQGSLLVMEAKCIEELGQKSRKNKDNLMGTEEESDIADLKEETTDQNDQDNVPFT